MATKAVYLVQTFEVHCKKLVPTTKAEAPSESAAKRRAENIAGRKAGAVVIALDMDSETGEVSKAAILARYGHTPDDLDQVCESF